MKLGLCLPQGAKTDLAKELTGFARRAEEIGYSSLWAYERVLFPLDPSDGMYGVPGLPWASFYEHCADPLTVLTLAGAVTERARLGTCLLVAPLHNELHLARTLATLDAATGGRVVAGLGSGWSTDEYRAAGADFAARGRSTDETVDALRALWGPNPVTYKDSRMSVTNALVNPKPTGTIPIVFGGGGERVIQRIAAKGDGWLPVSIPLTAIADTWRRILDAAEAKGRDPRQLELLPLAFAQFTDQPAGADRQPFQGTAAQLVEDAAAFAEAGTHELIIGLEQSTRDAAEALDRAAELFDAVKTAGVLTPTPTTTV